MAVRIAILSGDNQGQSHLFRASEFTVGNHPRCDLQVGTAQSSTTDERSVTLHQQEDGWYAQPNGTGIQINTTSLGGSTRIRSGDVVRLSKTSPAFAFQIEVRTPVNVGPNAQSAIPAASPSEAQSESAVGEDSPGKFSWLLITTAIGVVLLGLGAIFYSQRDASPPPAVAVDPPQTPQPAPNPKQLEVAELETTPAAPRKTEPSQTTTEPKTGLSDTEILPPQIQTNPPVDPWEQVLDKLRESIYLLAVEQPKTGATWPVATACAISTNTLLTTGNAVSELAKLRAQDWTLWAINEAKGTRIQITSIRQHIGFNRTDSEPEKRIYFDFGLVRVQDTLPTHAELADREELAAIEQGMPLGCVGIMREVEQLSRFDSNEPELQRGKVFLVTSLPPAPGPRLAHFRASLPHKPYGSPLVNADGKVCALFAESAVVPEGVGPDLNLHYAPIIDRGIIDAGLDASSKDVWVDLMSEKP